MRGWAAVALAAVVGMLVMGRCAQSRAARIAVLEDRAASAEARRDTSLSRLDSLRSELTIHETRIRDSLEAAGRRARESAARARAAGGDAHRLRQRLDSLITSPPQRLAFDSLTAAHDRQVDAYKAQVTDQATMIFTLQEQLSLRDRLIAAQDSAIIALTNEVDAKDALIEGLKAPSGFSLFGLEVKCGPSVAAGVSLTGGVDAVAGVGCSVG